MLAVSDHHHRTRSIYPQAELAVAPELLEEELLEEEPLDDPEDPEDAEDHLRRHIQSG